MAKIVRRPDRAEGGITPEEKIRLDEHAQMWIKRIMRTDPIEPDKIVPAIEGLYAAAGLKKPRVVIVPSPLVMAFAYGAASALSHKRGVKQSTYAATYAATYDATYDATHDATYDAIDSATNDATVAATRAATEAATHAATYAATVGAIYAATHAATVGAAKSPAQDPEEAAACACSQLAGKAGLEEAKRWGERYQGGNMWGQYDSWITAMRDVIGLRLPQHEKYRWWEEAAVHGGFRVMHPKFCIVSDFPEVLRKDEQNRAHCDNGPSHRWRDGWELFHWHGVRVPKEWIMDRESLTAQTALTQENVELRRAACEILGWEKILRELEAKVINADDDPEIGSLVEVSLPDAGKERFLRVRCGTGREFALPVPRDMKTALEAQAWTWGLDKKTFIKPEIRT